MRKTTFLRFQSDDVFGSPYTVHQPFYGRNFWSMLERSLCQKFLTIIRLEFVSEISDQCSAGVCVRNFWPIDPSIRVCVGNFWPMFSWNLCRKFLTIDTSIIVCISNFYQFSAGVCARNFWPIDLSIRVCVKNVWQLIHPLEFISEISDQYFTGVYVGNFWTLKFVSEIFDQSSLVGVRNFWPILC